MTLLQRASLARRASALMALLTLSVCGLAPVANAEETACAIGVYEGPAEDFIVMIRRPNGAWRYFFRDGRFGPPGDGVVSCRQGGLVVAEETVETLWPARNLRLTPTRFRSGEVELEGLLVEPDDPSPRPLVVVVHGSERTGSIDSNPYPWVFAAQGVSAFVYDKRGTGRSDGVYTQNFHRLAEDVVAASGEAKRLADGRLSRFGLFGGSQGGWVAPRAAPEAGAEFIVVGFGLLIDPLEEDAAQVASELAALGYDDAVLARAREVTEATGALMAAHFQSGYEALQDIRRRFGEEPWFGLIRGEFTGDILAMSEAELRQEGRARFDNLDIDWRYDALGWLRRVDAPQLWVIAGEDREAPPGLTLERLERLRKEGEAIDVAVFPNADHGMAEFVVRADGSRRPVRISDGYFRLLGDWIANEMGSSYGSAVLDPYAAAQAGAFSALPEQATRDGRPARLSVSGSASES